MSKFKVKFGEFMLEVAATPFAWDQNISPPPAGTAGHLSPNYSAGGWWLFFFSSLQSVQSVPAAPRLQIFALQKSLSGHGATVITVDQQADLSSRGQGQNNRNSQYAGRETLRLGDESQYQSV